jgi:hypothetical protein
MPEEEIVELKFTDPENEETTFFLFCPTVGDGDCFFHAAFTEDGDTLKTAKKKAGGMRLALWNNIQNDGVAESLKPFVAGQYWDILHKAARRGTSLEKPLPGIPQVVQNAYKKKGIKLEFKDIENLTTLIDVKDYMAQLQTVSDKLESFIPLDSNPDITVEPADLLAKRGNKQIRIFITNPHNAQELILLKTIGRKGDPIVNILQRGVHYTRLYARKEEKRDCRQIIKNTIENQRRLWG